MRVPVTRVAGCLAIVAALALVGARAEAQPAPSRADVAQAQTLFDDARRLMAKGEYGEACPKLEKSQALDPAPGTQFHLADCYEHTGRAASAARLFGVVADAARASNKPDKEQIARDRAAALEGRLSRVTVVVAPPSRVPGLVVMRDGAVVDEAAFGKPVAVDAGEHVVEASAPGRLPFRQVVAVREGAADPTVTVSLAAAAADAPTPAPVAPPASTSEPDAGGGLGPQRIVAIGVGALGVGGLVVGTVFGLTAKSKHDEAQADFCPTATQCTPRGVELTDDAQTAATVSTIGFVAGGVLVAGAAALFLTAPSRRAAPAAGLVVAPSVGWRAAGVGVSGRF